MVLELNSFHLSLCTSKRQRALVMNKKLTPLRNGMPSRLCRQLSCSLPWFNLRQTGTPSRRHVCLLSGETQSAAVRCSRT